MLKLTQTDTNTAIYVSARALMLGAIWELEHIGSGIQVGSREFWVTETPEQILAMPEMVRELIRLACLSPTQQAQATFFNPPIGEYLR
jgi:hypothetical protein